VKWKKTDPALLLGNGSVDGNDKGEKKESEVCKGKRICRLEIELEERRRYIRKEAVGKPMEERGKLRKGFEGFARESKSTVEKRVRNSTPGIPSLLPGEVLTIS